MTKEELDIQKEIENYFTESTGFGRDKIKNFMDIVNKALKQKGERITDLEQKLEQTEKDLTDYQFNYPKIKELEEQNKVLLQNLEDTEIVNKACKQRIEELEQQIEKMKQCGNCGNGTIGNCEYCKRKPDQIFADTLTSDYWRLKEIKRK